MVPSNSDADKSGRMPPEPLRGDAARSRLAGLDGWEVVRDHHLVRTFSFLDFAAALAFVNRVGVIAEAQGHHPDIHLAWGKARIEIWTHSIDGLSESDFVLAGKCDVAYTATGSP